MQKFKTFEELKNSRYNISPWDYPHNTMGFLATLPKNMQISELGKNRSDISAHLPILEYFASKCSHVTEFGFRECNSTVAFLTSTKGIVISYDIDPCRQAVSMLNAMKLPCIWKFIQANTNDIKYIDQTDLLFIDTLHTYNQVKSELRFYDKVSKYIIFHDTWSDGISSKDRPGENGILDAINEFLSEHPEWKKIYEVDFNHGLIILEKINIIDGEKDESSNFWRRWLYW